MSDLKPDTTPIEPILGETIPTGRDLNLTLWGDVWRKLKRDKRFWISATMVTIFILMALVPALFFTKDPNACNIHDTALRPSREHWFGTDLLGCDYYTRVIYGARTTFLVALVSSLIGGIGGTGLGLLAGYHGGVLDELVRKLVDMQLAFPYLLLAISAMAVAGRSLPILVVVLALSSWPVDES